MRKLLNLIAANANQPTQIRTEQDGAEATIYIYDVISDWFGISAAAVVRALSNIEAETLHVRINSPGGDVFEANAIRSALQEFDARVIVHVDGLAASAASSIMLAGDEIKISDGAFVMIHNAWMIALGDTREMSKASELLAKVDGDQAKRYAAKSGKSADEMRAAMAEETWYTAQEAVDVGLCDELVNEIGVENSFDLSAFDKVPKQLGKREPVTDDHAALAARYERRLALYERTAA